MLAAQCMLPCGQWCARDWCWCPSAGLSADSEAEDELHLLELEREDAEELEADAWASEEDSDAQAEATAAEHRTLPRISSKDDAKASQGMADMPPAQRPPPARRKWALAHALCTWVTCIGPALLSSTALYEGRCPS